MYSQRKFAQRTARLVRPLAVLAACVFAALGCLQPAVVHAQNTAMPADAMAQIVGDDISIEGGASASVGVPNGGPVYIFNGSVVTVHTGKAKLTFADGGTVDICGPAKVTILQSGGAMTLALSIGRMHLQLPAGAPVRVFTPTIIATPIDIGGAGRDITLGLDLNDSLCVLATSGALRLEQQFTGEGLIVPQSGDFLIPSGRLVPTAGVSGNCNCEGMQARRSAPTTTPNIPVMGVTSAADLAAPVAPTPEPASTDAKNPELPPAAQPNVQLRVLAKEDETHPLPQAGKNAAPPEPPPTAMPIYKIIMPPLGFSATSPTRPEDEPGLDAVLLVRTVHVEPEYEFSGHVDAPPLVPVPARANSGNGSQGNAKQAKEQKSGGFWSGLKRLFGGG